MSFQKSRAFTVLIATLILVSAGSALDTDLDSNDIVEDETVEYESFILDVDENNFDAEALNLLGVEIEYEYDLVDGVAVEAPTSVLDDLEDFDFIDEIEEDRETFLPDPDIEIELGEGEEEHDTREDSTEDVSDGEGVSIAVLDTGVAYDHQDFDGRVEFNKDFTGGDDPYDYDGHGTHVASIALGDGDHPGVAPEAGLQNIKVLGDDGSGRMSDVVAGIDHAVGENADVIVLSLGADVDACNGRDVASRAVDNAVSQGVAVVVASGNSGPDMRTVNAPGCSRDGFTVGATNNQNNNVADFSSRGATSDGRVKPDIVAPGTRVLAADASTTSGYKRLSGTSMAAPFVGGVIALQMEEAPNEELETYTDAITETAEDLGRESNVQGSGSIDVQASINAVTEEEEEELQQDSSGDVEQGDEGSDADEPREEVTLDIDELVEDRVSWLVSWFSAFLSRFVFFWM